MKKLSLTPLLLLTAFLAGCIQLGGEKMNRIGLTIKEFIVEPSIIDTTGGSEVDVLIGVTVQNNGEGIAKNVRGEVLGLQGGGFGVNKWDFDIADKLLPANPAQGLEEGEIGYGELSVIYKGGEVYTLLPYDFTVRVTYDYTTKAEGIVRVVSTTYFRETKQKGGLTTFSYTQGPIRVAARAPSSIAGSETEAIPVYIYLENVGGGMPYIDRDGDGKIETNEYYMVRIDSEKCEISSEVVRVPVGSRGFVACKLTVERGAKVQNIPFSMDISYSYLIDLPATITLLPALQVG